MPIELTEAAVNQLKMARVDQKLPENAVLRIGAKSSEPGRFSYFIGFDPNIRESDMRLQFGEIEIAVDPISFGHLGDSLLDYNPDPAHHGFLIKKMKQKAPVSRGCGTSFSV